MHEQRRRRGRTNSVPSPSFSSSSILFSFLLPSPSSSSSFSLPFSFLPLLPPPPSLFSSSSSPSLSSSCSSPSPSLLADRGARCQGATGRGARGWVASGGAQGWELHRGRAAMTGRTDGIDQRESSGLGAARRTGGDDGPHIWHRRAGAARACDAGAVARESGEWANNGDAGAWRWPERRRRRTHGGCSVGRGGRPGRDVVWIRGEGWAGLDFYFNWGYPLRMVGPRGHQQRPSICSKVFDFFTMASTCDGETTRQVS